MKRTSAVCRTLARGRLGTPGVCAPSPARDTPAWPCQRHCTRVPVPGREVTEAEPPTACILPMTEPEMPRRRAGTDSGSKPPPASDSSTTAPPASGQALSSASRTPAWRATLVTASRTPLNIASPGPDGITSGPSMCVLSRTLVRPSPSGTQPRRATRSTLPVSNPGMADIASRSCLARGASHDQSRPSPWETISSVALAVSCRVARYSRSVALRTAATSVSRRAAALTAAARSAALASARTMR